VTINTRRFVTYALAAAIAIFVVDRLFADKTQISQLALGLGTGALIAVIGIGVVLTYRGSGVVNFANGVVAIFTAYEFFDMRTKGRIFLPPLPNPLALVEGIVNRFKGRSHRKDWLKLPRWPTSLPAPFKSGDHVAFIPAVILSIVVAIIFGLLLHFLIFRPLRKAPPLAKVVASVGLLIFLQQILILRFGAEVKPTAAILPTTARHFTSDIIIPENQLLLALIALILAAALYALFRLTRFGLATRAAAENEKGALLLGFSPDFLAGANWVLSTVLAGVLGILVTPLTTLDPIFLPFLIVPALGAALLGNFTSFGVTAMAGLGVGALQSLVTLYSARTWYPKDWLPASGVAKSLPFIVIVIAMFVRGRALPQRGSVLAGRLPFAWAPSKVLPLSIIGTVGALGILFGMAYDWRQAVINTMVIAIISLSLVVLTGFVGQISLAQGAIAGTAGFALSKFFSHWPFPLGPIAAALIATGFGLLIAIPALRVRGVNLAVITLAAAVAIEELVLNNPKLVGIEGAMKVKPARLFGKNFSIQNTDLKIAGLHGKDKIPPNAWFGVLCLVVVLVMALLVVNIRRSATGRRFLAVRSNERAAAAAGVSVSGTKLLAFGLSAFIAGIGGVMSGYRFESVTPAYFGALGSLTFLAFAYLGGISSVLGGIVAGLLGPNGIIFTIFDKWFHIDPKYTVLLGGFGLIFTAIQNPEGIAGGIKFAADQFRRMRGSGKAAAPPAEAPAVQPAMSGEGH
jgi:branched-chain amino acid transport system permease protein